MSKPASRPLRSRAWFDNPASPDLTALYIEKYLVVVVERVGHVDGRYNLMRTKRFASVEGCE